MSGSDFDPVNGKPLLVLDLGAEVVTGDLDAKATR